MLSRTLIIIGVLLIIWHLCKSKTEGFGKANMYQIPLMWDRNDWYYYVWGQYSDESNKFADNRMAISFVHNKVYADQNTEGVLEFPHSNYKFPAMQMFQTDPNDTRVIGLGYLPLTEEAEEVQTVNQLGSKYNSITVYFNSKDGFLSFKEPTMRDGAKLNLIYRPDVAGYAVEFGVLSASKNTLNTGRTDTVSPKISKTLAIIDPLSPFLKLPNNIYCKVKEYIQQQVDLHNVSDKLWDNWGVKMTKATKNSFPTFILTLNSPGTTSMFSIWLPPSRYIRWRNGYYIMLIKKSEDTTVTMGNSTLSDVVMQVHPKKGIMYIKDA